MIVHLVLAQASSPNKSNKIDVFILRHLHQIYISKNDLKYNLQLSEFQKLWRAWFYKLELQTDIKASTVLLLQSKYIYCNRPCGNTSGGKLPLFI